MNPNKVGRTRAAKMRKMERITVPTILEQKLFGAQITREPWTPETVRADLPDVEVMFLHAGMPITITCIVSGRKEQFATVRPFRYGSATTWQFSWEAIAHSLNSGTPLRV